MKIELKNNNVIECLIALLEDAYSNATEEIAELEKEVAELKAAAEKEKSQHVNVVELKNEIADLKDEVEIKAKEINRLVAVEIKCMKLAENAIENACVIKKLEEKNRQLEDLQKKTAKTVSQADLDFMKKEHLELVNTIDRLTSENLKLKRMTEKVEKKATPGDVIGEMMETLIKKPGRPKKVVV